MCSAVRSMTLHQDIMVQAMQATNKAAIVYLAASAAALFGVMCLEGASCCDCSKLTVSTRLQN